MPASSHSRQRNNAHARCSHHAPRTPDPRSSIPPPARLRGSRGPLKPMCRRKRYCRSPRCNPTPKRRCEPPDQSRKCSRWGRPGFRHPASTWTPSRPVRAAQPPHMDQGESQANPSRAAPLQDGRQTAAAHRKRFIRFPPARTALLQVPQIRAALPVACTTAQSV